MNSSYLQMILIVDVLCMCGIYCPSVGEGSFTFDPPSGICFPQKGVFQVFQTQVKALRTELVLIAKPTDANTLVLFGSK